MKTIRIRAGHSRRIAYFGDGMGQVLEFRAEAEGGGEPGGQIELKRKAMFGFKSELSPLRAQNSITIGRMTYQNSISVVPEVDTVVTITKGVKSLGAQLRTVVLVAVLLGLGLLGAFAASKLGLLPPPGESAAPSNEASP